MATPILIKIHRTRSVGPIPSKSMDFQSPVLCFECFMCCDLQLKLEGVTTGKFDRATLSRLQKEQVPIVLGCYSVIFQLWKALTGSIIYITRSFYVKSNHMLISFLMSLITVALCIQVMSIKLHSAIIFPSGTRPGESTEPIKTKGKSTIWVAAVVGGLVILVIILVAFVVYQVRR